MERSCGAPFSAMRSSNMHILQERIFEGRNLKVLLLKEPTLREQSSIGTLCGRPDLMLVDAERCSKNSGPKGPGPVLTADMEVHLVAAARVLPAINAVVFRKTDSWRASPWHQ